MKPNPIQQKTYKFALRIINAYKFLHTVHKEYVLSKQLLRSGTSIGAQVMEAEHAQSKPDFLNKMNIALKEANETSYWLHLLKDSNYLDNNMFISIHTDCIEIIKLLSSIVKTTKNSLNK
ncbi:four helix bundle protein [Danxiaibacter flavus]|uniref:Four helix bundle protein n=1 Tax=Danxiaibacter flavus TaxID=3049108 RepID=A0ABV3ZA39_9BACT|nr:four helix bundle protein [Chitinophagaceae bacterium DXS]